MFTHATERIGASEAPRRWLLAVAACLIGGACTHATDIADPPPEAPAALPVGAIDPGAVPFDLGAVMDQVHFAYRPGDAAGQFRGGHATYAVDADARGATLRALHRVDPPRGAPDAAEPLRPIEGAPLRIETVSLTHGERSLIGQDAGEAEVAEDGHLTIGRGEVVEHLHNRDEGVEQSWAFARAPSGQGDVHVSIRATGLAYVGETGAGLHFADATGLGFRYGHGVFVDASGVETPVPARWVDGAIVLTVPARVVEAAAYPAVLDPTISPEFGMDEPVRVDGGFTTPQVPQVASNGMDYLVTWGDSSSDLVRATRVSAAGVVLDPLGIRLCEAAGWRGFPAVASNGSDYLLIWHGITSGAWGVFGTRIDAAGRSLDVCFPILRSGSIAVVASDGRDYLVVSTVTGEVSGSNGVYGVRVSREGLVLDESRLRLSPVGDTVDGFATRVASNGDGYLVAWLRSDAAGSEVYAARVGSDGSLPDTDPIALPHEATFSTTPAVASDGTDYFVIWSAARGPGSAEIRGARVTAAGVLVDSEGLLLAADLRPPRATGVALSGDEYLVVWDAYNAPLSSYAVFGTRVRHDGVGVGAPAFVIADDPWRDDGAPSVAGNGSDFLVAWSTHGRIRSKRVRGGVVLDGAGLSVDDVANRQVSPAVASNGTEYLVVWADSRGTTALDVFAVRLSATGVVLDPSGLAVTVHEGSQQLPAVGSDGRDFLVAWTDSRDGAARIYGARVDAHGAVRDPDGVSISSADGDTPSVASNGDGYLVAWTHREETTSDILGARVSAGGRVLDTDALPLCVSAGRQSAARVASNGSEYLAVWCDQRHDRGAVYGARVDGAGSLLDPEGIEIAAVAGGLSRPSLASDGTDYLVVFESGPPGTVGGVHVGADGVPRHPAFLVASDTGPFPQTTVAASGGSYLVAWGSPGLTNLLASRVRAAFVEPPVFIATEDSYAPALVAATTPNRFLLVYERFVRDAPFHTTRVRARFIDYRGALGDPCSAADDCESGLCADSVCCDRACDGGRLDCQACSLAAGAAQDGVCGPATGSTCDDGVGCTAQDTCEAGLCRGVNDPCFDATTCTEGEGGAYTCSPCPAGSASTDGSGTTACVPCAPGSYAPDVGTTACLPATVCDATQYETAAPTATTDRACAALTVCAAGQYEASAPTTTRDRGCRRCTVCGAGTREVTACGDTADTVCERVDAPDAGRSDAGRGDASTDPAPDTGCGCRAFAEERPSQGLVLAAVVALLIARRRARRRCSPAPHATWRARLQ